jgi:SAM-dependent methyltransferase
MSIHNPNKEKGNVHYNDFYAIVDAYRKHPNDVFQYIDMWNKAVGLLKAYNIKSIIDLGCGPGQFAHLVSEHIDDIDVYYGYDFSETAIKMANKRELGPKYLFEIKNLKNENFINNSLKNLAYITFEFLEHINEDLEVLLKIPSGSRVIFSVPSFDYKSHVRYFPDKSDVLSRYGKYIDIESVFVFDNNPNIRDGKVLYLCDGIAI